MDKIRSTLAWEVQSEQWRRENGQYIPNPATWLNQERWNDEPEQKPAAREFIGPTLDELKARVKSK